MDRNDLFLNGIGSVPGGVFDRARINGTGTIDGNVECQEFESNGAGTVRGDLRTERFRSSGTVRVKGYLDMEEGRVEGAASIKYDTDMKNLKISGATTIGGLLKGEELNLEGKLSVHMDCEVERFLAEGMFHIGGLLKAEEIDVILFGECKASEIEAQRIRVRQKKGTLSKLIQTVFPAKLKVHTIEGDQIELEYTRAEMVRGQDVVLGPGCDIDLVEYKGTLQQDQQATVRKARKL